MVLAFTKQLHQELLVLSESLLVSLTCFHLIFLVDGLLFVPERAAVEDLLLDLHREVELFFGSLRQRNALQHLLSSVLELYTRTSSVGEACNSIIDGGFILLCVLVVLGRIGVLEIVVVALKLTLRLTLTGLDNGLGPRQLVMCNCPSWNLFFVAFDGWSDFTPSGFGYDAVDLKMLS